MTYLDKLSTDVLWDIYCVTRSLWLRDRIFAKLHARQFSASAHMVH